MAIFTAAGGTITDRFARGNGRKYLPDDYAWSCRRQHDGALCYGPEPNTNAVFYGFLGCNFREFAPDHDPIYEKLPEPFVLFPWVRHDFSSGPNYLSRCGAELSFLAEGESSVPVRKMEELRGVFMSEYGVDFKTVERTPASYLAERFGSDGFRVTLYMTNFLRQVSMTNYINYVLGFEVVDERSARGTAANDGTILPYWTNVLHETIIPASKLESDGFWRYVPETGPSTEELLDEWVRTGDRRFLDSGGKTDLGMCLSWRKGKATVCREWEADDYCPFVGAFVRAYPPEVGNRMYQKLIHPSMFKPGVRTTPDEFTVGSIFCELIPGDKVIWYQDDCLKIGIVCEDDEDGEYWECIKRKMKSVKTTAKPKLILH